MSLALRQKQIIDFNNSAEYKDLAAFYAQTSLFGALGVSRHENTHNNFLAWLLTPSPEKNDHKLGFMPLRKLLEVLALVSGSLTQALGKLSPEMSNAVISGSYTLSNIIVEREKHIGVGRLDIYLEGHITFDGRTRPLRLAIENKIKSAEADGQTGRYQTALNRGPDAQTIFLGIYLTPLNNRAYEALNAPECEAKDFIQLNYQYLADYVIIPCRNHAPEGNIRQYLDEYLLTLGLPELRQDKGDIIMAISKEERDLLARFWDTHKELLIAAMLSMLDNDALDDAEHEVVSKASQALKDVVARDMTRYTWNFQGGGQKLPKNRLVLEVVAHYAGEHPHITLAQLKDKFPDSLQGGTFGVVAPLDAAGAENFKGHKRYYTDEAIRLEDTAVAVCNQWRADNIAAFISCAAALGYEISSTGDNA